MRRFAVLSIGLIVAALGACGTPKPPSAFEEAFDDEERPWQEVETQLPAKPADADIVPFQVSGGTGYRFGIDAKSLSIGTDDVYRYTLVATSAQGARNVSYEGIRCETAQKKIYAIGRVDGTWVKSRSAAWTPIVDVGVNRQDAALLREYFCPDGYAARSSREVFAHGSAAAVQRSDVRPGRDHQGAMTRGRPGPTEPAS